MKVMVGRHREARKPCPGSSIQPTQAQQLGDERATIPPAQVASLRTSTKPIRIPIQKSNFTETTLIPGKTPGVKFTEEHERSREIRVHPFLPEDLTEWKEMKIADTAVETLKTTMFPGGPT